MADDNSNKATIIGDGNIIGDNSVSLVVKLYLNELEAKHGQQAIEQILQALCLIIDHPETDDETREEAAALYNALNGKTVDAVRQDEDLLRRLGRFLPQLVKTIGITALVGNTLHDLWLKFKAWQETPAVRPVPDEPEPRPKVKEPEEPEFDPRPQYSFEPEMIRIAAGEFLMGSDPAVDYDAMEQEQPQHRLYLPEYYIAKTPVTNRQYAAFVEATGHRAPEYAWGNGRPVRNKLDHPVRDVSWYDTVAYREWLSKRTGKPYGLPSEAEWEKAARGIDGRIYPWGNQKPDKRRFNYNTGETTPVGQYSPLGDSPYGCVDIAGNAWEWTRSLWGKAWEEPLFTYPYDPKDGRENMDAGDDVARVLRGGAFVSGQGSVRCASRSRYSPYFRSYDLGFRLVVSPYL